eukprot:TRINITY_DN4202_c0_g1_i2.p2 TRINITY_DN4202_c0_g1~~TRINITY_DN4202_c0_g1_i2.p2  ORF type:complete len:113 (-),score=36.98 TRINITY_DN4202_c0_g1_i2:68-406(-)
MWSLFAKYEGLDKTGDYHVFTVPTILDKKFQGQLYFEKESKKLRKVSSHAFEFVVDKFDAFTDVNEIFTVHPNCKTMNEEEMAQLRNTAASLFDSFKSAMSQTEKAMNGTEN